MTNLMVTEYYNDNTTYHDILNQDTAGSGIYVSAVFGSLCTVPSEESTLIHPMHRPRSSFSGSC